MALKLSKAGYGTPEEILNMRADIVIHALVYEGFCFDYNQAFIYMNNSSQ